MFEKLTFEVEKEAPQETMYILQLFRENEHFERRWGAVVGVASNDLNYLHRQAKKLVEVYCHSHPSNSLYHSDEREYVAESKRKKGVDFGVSIRVYP